MVTTFYLKSSKIRVENMSSSYLFRTAEHSHSFETSWVDAQHWCNFVLFRPSWLPKGWAEKVTTIRPESPHNRASHRSEFHGPNGSISIKQFLYDWAPPAYDHPCLWRNAELSGTENTPIPKAYLLGNNYVWFGLDYRKKSAATINMMRTQIEITTLNGLIDERDIKQIMSGLISVDIHAKNVILATSFAELMFESRHLIQASEVPVSYFKHTRTQDMTCYPFLAQTIKYDKSLLPGHWLIDTPIENYRLDSLFLFGPTKEQILEVEYYFESTVEVGSYIRFLVTPKEGQNSIQYPPELSDQECHYAIQKLENDNDVHHAWSKTNDNGSHSLIFQAKDTVIQCIIKSAPWTTSNWCSEMCTKALLG